VQIVTLVPLFGRGSVGRFLGAERGCRHLTVVDPAGFSRLLQASEGDSCGFCKRCLEVIIVRGVDPPWEEEMETEEVLDDASRPI